MSDIKELNDKELDQVNGGLILSVYNKRADLSFDCGDIVEEDDTGIRYQILNYNCTEQVRENSLNGMMHWL